jgi:putative tricarboxylic transport membrane protein
MSEDPHEQDAAGARPAAARLPRDFVVGACVLAFCGVAYAVTLTFKEAPAALAQNVQPATFPRLVISVIAVFSIVLMVLSFRLPAKALKPVPATVPVSAAVMVGFAAAFGLLGFLPAMILLCLGLPVIWGERRWGLIVPFAILFPAAIYGLFAVVLGVHFDAGVLAFW